jgi:hypothetical protein
VFVDVISVSAVLYIINFANCYQNDPKNARKEAKEGREGKEQNSVEEKTETDNLRPVFISEKVET